MTVDEDAIFTLHRYFIWTNRMRTHLEETLQAQGPLPEMPPNASAEKRAELDQVARVWFLPVFIYRSYWLASLYVVVEGWEKLGIQDPAVSALLSKEFTKKLKLHRHGIFHYMPKYLDPKVEATGGVNPDAFVLHAAQLHDAIDAWFVKWFKDRGEWPALSTR